MSGVDEAIQMMKEELRPEVLEIGTDASGHVVLLYRNLTTDENGVGNILMTPEQAKDMAKTLLKHAKTARRRNKERFRPLAVN